MEILEAPWSEDQVKSINDYQSSGSKHPALCPNDLGVLQATLTGLYCPECSYFTETVPEFMADESWRELTHVPWFY